jgi:hypothetical protein
MLLNGELNENETVDLKSIPTGVYTLTVINDQNQKETIKLVKK